MRAIALDSINNAKQGDIGMSLGVLLKYFIHLLEKQLILAH
ncbi:hypothetical protein [Mycoplasmopsis cynos]|nr:hypothetical protein [Mycoplasmopsis cynos]WAM04602.1 hypothetical protein ONA01_06490 [Mycoplasmopsis cynos]